MFVQFGGRCGRYGSDDEFDLYYVRAGRKTAHPLVVIPGGPGAASVALYRGFRRRAAAEGLDVIMVEHRGVGMSRHDDRGADLPPEALTIDQVVDDVAAVLDDAGVDKAVIYGTSYGTYLAAGFGVRHPHRVHAMVLDSPVLSAQDIDAVREATRRLLWNGDDPETADLAPKVRRLVGDDQLTPAATQLAMAVYGFAGPTLLRRQLDLLLTGRRWLWSGMAQATRLVLERKAPYRNEPDLVDRIGYRELNYGATPGRQAVRSRGGISRSCHGHNGIRCRTVRPGRRDAEVHLADSGDLRRPRPDHPADGGTSGSPR